MKVLLSSVCLLFVLTGPAISCGIGTSPSEASAQEADDDPISPQSGVIINQPSSPGVVLATAPDPEADPGSFLTALLDAAKNGQWRLLAGLLLMLAVWAARRFGSGLVPWFATDRGGAALVLVLALLGGVATTLLADGPFGLGLLVNSLSMAFVAAGGWQILKRLLNPKDA